MEAVIAPSDSSLGGQGVAQQHRRRGTVSGWECGLPHSSCFSTVGDLSIRSFPALPLNHLEMRTASLRPEPAAMGWDEP